MSAVKATVLQDMSDLPEGYFTRQDITTKLHLDIPQNTFSYAARMGKLGQYYAVGRLCYYNFDLALDLWGKPGQKAAATKAKTGKKAGKKAAKKVAKKGEKRAVVETKATPTPGVRLIREGELPELIGRTPAEVSALLAADEFLPAGCHLSDGTALWALDTVRGWLEKNPAPAPTLVFKGDKVEIDRPIRAGAYRLEFVGAAAEK